jgi:hypothetical protein
MKRPVRVLRLFCYLCASLSSRLLKSANECKVDVHCVSRETPFLLNT